MNTMNPFQMGWGDDSNSSSATAPPTYGALTPGESIPSQLSGTLVTLQFLPQGNVLHGVLDCTVWDSNNQPRFFIQTVEGNMANATSVTHIKNTGGDVAATIRWGAIKDNGGAIVDRTVTPNNVISQAASSFLQLVNLVNPHSSVRRMKVGTKEYEWAGGNQHGSLELHEFSYNRRGSHLGGASRNVRTSGVDLKLVPSACYDILEHVIAVVLLYSNRQI